MRERLLKTNTRTLARQYWRKSRPCQILRTSLPCPLWNWPMSLIIPTLPIWITNTNEMSPFPRSWTIVRSVRTRWRRLRRICKISKTRLSQEKFSSVTRSVCSFTKKCYVNPHDYSCRRSRSGFVVQNSQTHTTNVWDYTGFGRNHWRRKFHWQNTQCRHEWLSTHSRTDEYQHLYLWYGNTRQGRQNVHRHGWSIRWWKKSMARSNKVNVLPCTRWLCCTQPWNKTCHKNKAVNTTPKVRKKKQ